MRAPAGMGEAIESVRLEGITKRFDRVVAVDRVSLVVRRGEFVCLLGPSGCGKTTTLRMIAGFVEPDEGRIAIDGEDVTDRPPNRRDIGMVYQSYALFPHMTVFDNVAFGLRMRGIGRAQRGERVRQALALVDLAGLEERRPAQLSGGQQQRVALARAIVIQPSVLLLDEPLSNLDAKLRQRMQLELRALQRRVGITTIHVTHDQEEALTLADTVVILNRGAVEQVGSPQDVYARPRSAFVGDFLGRANFLAGRLAAGATPSTGIAFVADRGEALAVRDEAGLPAGTAVQAFIRPEHVQLRRAPEGRGTENGLPGRVTQVVFGGSVVTIEIETETGRRLIVERPSGGPEATYEPGEAVTAVLPREALRILADPG
jgi:putative spermidine/putrescine transport system ATP-binding protein